jgi:hypothetical protein
MSDDEFDELSGMKTERSGKEHYLHGLPANVPFYYAGTGCGSLSVEFLPSRLTFQLSFQLEEHVSNKHTGKTMTDCFPGFK